MTHGFWSRTRLILFFLLSFNHFIIISIFSISFCIRSSTQSGCGDACFQCRAVRRIGIISGHRATRHIFGRHFPITSMKHVDGRHSDRSKAVNILLRHNCVEASTWIAAPSDGTHRAAQAAAAARSQRIPRRSCSSCSSLRASCSSCTATAALPAPVVRLEQPRSVLRSVDLRLQVTNELLVPQARLSRGATRPKRATLPLAVSPGVSTASAAGRLTCADKGQRAPAGARWQGATTGGRFDLPSTLAATSTSSRSLSGRTSARAPASARATPSARPTSG